MGVKQSRFGMLPLRQEEGSMPLVRRDVVVAVGASVLTGAAILAAQSAPAGMLGSRVFDYTKIPVKKTAIGETRQVVSAPARTLNNLEIHITTLNPGQQSHPPHTHPNEELILLRSGTLEGFVHGAWVPMPNGSILLNASMDPHAVRNPSQTEPAQYFVVNWTSTTTPKAPEAAK
jgi:XRE family transcriptional regulator, regulator of sulfur utilization